MKRKPKILKMQTDIQDALLNEIEHVKAFLLFQEEDIELIKNRLQQISSGQPQQLVVK